MQCNRNHKKKKFISPAANQNTESPKLVYCKSLGFHSSHCKRKKSLSKLKEKIQVFLLCFQERTHKATPKEKEDLHPGLCAMNVLSYLTAHNILPAFKKLHVFFKTPYQKKKKGMDDQQKESTM